MFALVSTSVPGFALTCSTYAVAGEMTQRRAQPDPDRYLGKGKSYSLGFEYNF